MSEQDAAREEAPVSVGTQDFDHPNVEKMDNQFMITMNQEHIIQGFIRSGDMEVVKSDIKIFGHMERIFAGHVNVETARAIRAGEFTLERAVERARDGFERRMEQSQYSYEYYAAPKKPGGLLAGLRNALSRNKETVEQYPAERRQ